MQSQVLRYIRFFIFGCWGILLLLMLLYGPWMIQAKQITIPDISITNFMIRDTSSFFPCIRSRRTAHWRRQGCPVRNGGRTQQVAEYAACRFLLLLFPLCTKVLRTRFSDPLVPPSLGHQRNVAPSSLPRPACVFPDPSLSPTLRSLKERARSERIAAGILRHFLLHAIFRHGRAGMFAGNPGLRPESSLVPSFQ